MFGVERKEGLKFVLCSFSFVQAGIQKRQDEKTQQKLGLSNTAYLHTWQRRLSDSWHRALACLLDVFFYLSMLYFTYMPFLFLPLLFHRFWVLFTHLLTCITLFVVVIVSWVQFHSWWLRCIPSLAFATCIAGRRFVYMFNKNYLFILLWLSWQWYSFVLYMSTCVSVFTCTWRVVYWFNHITTSIYTLETDGNDHEWRHVCSVTYLGTLFRRTCDKISERRKIKGGLHCVWSVRVSDEPDLTDGFAWMSSRIENLSEHVSL